MKNRAIASAFIIAVACGAIGHAQTGALKVLASNGFRAVMDELMPRCEKAIGRHVSTISMGKSSRGSSTTTRW